eukprot:PhF_6_TR1979/c0_g2_i1/m.3300
MRYGSVHLPLEPVRWVLLPVRIWDTVGRVLFATTLSVCDAHKGRSCTIRFLVQRFPSSKVLLGNGHHNQENVVCVYFCVHVVNATISGVCKRVDYFIFLVAQHFDAAVEVCHFVETGKCVSGDNLRDVQLVVAAVRV